MLHLEIQNKNSFSKFHHQTHHSQFEDLQKVKDLRMHYAINDIVGSVLFGTISQFSAFDREIISSSKRCKNLSHSERSPTKELLISSEKIIDCLNDGVYVCDRDRRIVFWSKAAERITGWRSEDVLGRACLEDILNRG